MTRFLPTALGLALGLTLTGGAARSQDAALEEDLRSIAANLPRAELTPDFVFTGAEADGATLRVFVSVPPEVVGFVARQSDPDIFSVCDDPVLRPLIDRGAAFEFVFVVEEHGETATKGVAAEICERAAPDPDPDPGMAALVESMGL